MATTRVYKRGTLEFDRVAFFSDAVFAIAMTLLVVGIEVPKLVNAAQLGDSLRDLESSILSFFISFIVIGFYWRGHHRFFAILRAVDNTFITMNMAFLAIIAFVPFPTALIGAYEQEPVAFVLYAVTLTAASLALVLLNAHATRARLREAPLTGDARRHELVAQAIPIVIFLLSIPLALATSTSVALWSWASIWVFESVIDRVWPADDPPLASVHADD